MSLAKSITNMERAEVIAEALPYIKKYNSKIIVVKYGGSAMTSDELKQTVMQDIVLLTLIGVKVALVHGGGPKMSEIMKKLGKKPDFIDGLRVTDPETIEVAKMVLAGDINKSLVNALGVLGAAAMGISGIDARMVRCVPKDQRLGLVGEITNVDPTPILNLFEKGYIPVVSTLGTDDDGTVYNINGDTFATHIAGALKAERLIMMTDTDGILRKQSDPESLIPELSIREALDLKDQGIISGGMIPKVSSCIEAIRMGVKNCIIINGCTPHAILLELLTEEGIGTLIKP